MTDKIKCRFHPNGKCPKKLPMQQPAPLIAGELKLNNKTYTARSIVRYAKMKSDVAKLNKDWTIIYEKQFIRLIRTNGLSVIVNSFNPKFYNPNEILQYIQAAVDNIVSDLDVHNWIKTDRPGAG